MAAEIQVRRATLDDAEAIARIHNQGIDDRSATFETEPRTADSVKALLEKKGTQYPTVVVVRGQHVIGWASVGAYGSRPCYAGIGEFSVYVERTARGSGVGRAAMQGLFAACEQQGFWKLVSRVFPENAASLGLLATLGFRQVGVYHRHARLDGAWRDCVIVEKLLGEAAER